MNTEAKAEQIKDATRLAYTQIRLSGLYEMIDNETWDRLSGEWGKYVVNLLDEFIDNEFTKIEEAKVQAGS